MANYRSTADYLDSILLLSGETTNGNSQYEARALHYLNRVHNLVLLGGNEFNVEVDEIWPWALSPTPTYLELQPKYDTGTISITEDALSGTFSTAPTISLAGYHLRPDGSKDIYKIISHTASTTAFTLESAFASSTLSGSGFEAYKLDYELIPAAISITSRNNKITFTETTTSTPLVATITVGSYTITSFLAEVKTQLESAGGSTFTVTYNSVTRKFTIASDVAGGDGIFSILGASGSSSDLYASTLPTVGFPLKDQTGATSYTSERALGAIGRLVQPLVLHTGYTETAEIHGLDKPRFDKEYPLSSVGQGNPTRFSVIEEDDDGYVKVRMNSYASEAKRVEVNYVPIPLTLADSSASHPMIPAKHSQILEHGPAALLLAEKNDNRAPQYFSLAGATLTSMMKNLHKNRLRYGKHYGQIIARPDLMSEPRRRLKYGYTED